MTSIINRKDCTFEKKKKFEKIFVRLFLKYFSEIFFTKVPFNIKRYSFSYSLVRFQNNSFATLVHNIMIEEEHVFKLNFQFQY